jgi:Leucine-rich repeat (LRR) protein
MEDNMRNKRRPFLRQKLLYSIFLLAFLFTICVGNPIFVGAQNASIATPWSAPTPTQISQQNEVIPEADDMAPVRLWYDTQGDLWVETPYYRWNITGGMSLTALSDGIEYTWSANSPRENTLVIDQLFLSASADTKIKTRIFYALPDEAVVYLERTTTQGIEGLEMAFRSSDGQIRLTHRWQGPDLPVTLGSQKSPLASDATQVKDQSGTILSSNQDGATWGYLSSFDPSTQQGQSFIWRNDVPPAQGLGASCFTDYPSQEPSVHDPCQFPNFFLPGQALSTEYLLIYTADPTASLKPVEKAISALDLNLPDLDVANFTRTPRFDYDAAKNNPAPGDIVTFTARVANRGGQPTGVFQYTWYIDQIPIQSSSYASLNPGNLISLSLNWTWQDGPHVVRLQLDPSNTISEVSEQNNSLTDRTNGLAVGFWVEQSVYDYFNLHQVELGLGSVSWEDWAQRQLGIWNQMMADAIHPLTPQGIIDRVRLDKVTVVPDGALPDPSPSNFPDINDKTVDMMWGFTAESVWTDGFYIIAPSAQNYDPALLHELSHARYLLDLYGLDIGFGVTRLNSQVNSTETTLNLQNSVNDWFLPTYLAIEGELLICQQKSGNFFLNCERGAEGTIPRAHEANVLVHQASLRLQNGQGSLVMGSQAMPVIGYDDHVYYNRYPDDLMSGGLSFGSHSAYAWNRIAGKRPVCGNYNAPCNIGEYANDLPRHNVIEIHDTNGQILPNVRIELYQAKPNEGWYGKLYLNTPDATYYTDIQGRADLGSFPFGQGPKIVHSYGHSNANLLLKITSGENSIYRFFEVTQANETYWSGQQNIATYVFETTLSPYNCANVTEIPLTECQTLVALYNSTHGINWVNHTNWLNTTSPCSWYGILCSQGHVVSLFLYSNHLTGSIPVDLGNLSQITVVDLSRNQLAGSIPKQLGNLLLLERLSLYNNQLTGTIPTELGNLKHLTDLALNNNLLTGSIPSEFSNLSQLLHLWLHNNQLTGNIPPELGNLTQLRYLHLHHNQLSGNIPSELGNLTNLEYLLLSNNQLSGSIPKKFGYLIQLTQLDLGYNQLTGSIPTELGNLTKLEYLGLNNNQLSGSIPITLGNLTELLSLWLSTNQLSGGIPSELGNLSKLSWLVLNDNQLSGNIPPQLGNLILLERLYLYNNQLTGSIPTEVGNSSHLKVIELSRNKVTGNIPTELGNLTQLTDLRLNSNQIRGEFPSSITRLVNLTSLTFDCWLTSYDINVIAFIDSLVPGWQNKTCPTILSITCRDPTPTSAASVNFTVTFSESVSGVNAGDFTLDISEITGSSITAVIPITATTYQVTVNTGTGNGTIRLDVIDNDSIRDASNNPLGGPGTGNGSFAAGQTYTIEKHIFNDVPETYWSWQYIERLYGAGVTSGCSTTPLFYCPTTPVTRDQMAVFLLRGKHGSGYTPPLPTGVFTDVPTNYWSAAWIEQLALEGITSGCSVSPKQYCPTTPVTRDQMAVFLLRAKYGSSYVPPKATGVFQDVPPGYWAADWIEQLAAEGVTSGCSVTPKLYCPNTPVTRDQMAVFLVRNFSLP